MVEKDAALNLNSGQIGGKTMYFMSWMEGSHFKNVLSRVSCWVKFVDVPYSYWSKNGLNLIAKTIGKPMKFDEATSRLEPLKFSLIQVELEYSTPSPPSIWVPTLCNGIEGKQKVDIIYPQMPYSCSICKAFGHSLARCSLNPDAVKPSFHQKDKHSKSAKQTGNNAESQENQVTANTDISHLKPNIPLASVKFPKKKVVDADGFTLVA